eukprot:3158568-Amphidinium_carterae.1
MVLPEANVVCGDEFSVPIPRCGSRAAPSGHGTLKGTPMHTKAGAWAALSESRAKPAVKDPDVCWCETGAVKKGVMNSELANTQHAPSLASCTSAKCKIPTDPAGVCGAVWRTLVHA